MRVVTFHGEHTGRRTDFCKGIKPIEQLRNETFGHVLGFQKVPWNCLALPARTAWHPWNPNICCTFGKSLFPFQGIIFFVSIGRGLNLLGDLGDNGFDVKKKKKKKGWQTQKDVSCGCGQCVCARGAVGCAW